MSRRRRQPERLPAVPERSAGLQAVGDDEAGPLWVPDGVALRMMPPEVRDAIGRLVEPVYRQFVLDVDDPLEKSLGLTLVHLMWMEILQQHDLKREYTRFSAPLDLPDNYSKVIDQHLRILDSKVRMGHFLVRLREFRDRHDPAGQ